MPSMRTKSSSGRTRLPSSLRRRWRSLEWKMWKVIYKISTLDTPTLHYTALHVFYVDNITLQHT